MWFYIKRKSLRPKKMNGTAGQLFMKNFSLAKMRKKILRLEAISLYIRKSGGTTIPFAKTFVGEREGCSLNKSQFLKKTRLSHFPSNYTSSKIEIVYFFLLHHESYSSFELVKVCCLVLEWDHPTYYVIHYASETLALDDCKILILTLINRFRIK